jgi:hypothetical protein
LSILTAYALEYPKEFVYSTTCQFVSSRLTGKSVQNLSFYSKMGIDKFHPKYNGQSICVGLISTGFNYEHAAFKS